MYHVQLDNQYYTRPQQDIVLGNIILWTIHQSLLSLFQQSNNDKDDKDHNNDNNDNDIISSIFHSPNDSIDIISSNTSPQLQQQQQQQQQELVM